MSDEVSKFLEQVGKLRDQQIEEDEVRARELEEYIAAKRERQARREERARSISPQKSSPINTPSPRSSHRSLQSADISNVESSAIPRDESSESRETSIEPKSSPGPMSGVEVDAMGNPSSPTKENQSPNDLESKRTSGSSAPTRTSTLSWQRRPASRGGSRPLSMLAAQNATQRSLAAAAQEPSPTSDEQPTLSKDQIAQTLGAKDPSWFRQTADRGQSSAAYRRSQVEDEDKLDMSSVRAQLPGMSAAEDRKDKPPSGSSTPSEPRASLASPIPLNPPRFENPNDVSSPIDRQIPTSPSGRVSPTRSTSPTKGMGGFVQSAMMKRSDSVKRWSVTSPPGLTRADSIASSRGAYDRPSSLASSRPQSMVRGGSTTPTSSRPVSQQIDVDKAQETTPKGIEIDRSPRASQSPDRGDEDAALPPSPSKTMDSRRWSPTKSSWLESALNRPESPKPQAKPQTPSQPAWKVEFEKKRAEGANSGSGASHKHQVSIGGLMRSSPMGAGSKPNATGLGGIYSPPPGGNKPTYGHTVKSSLSTTALSPHPTDADRGTPDGEEAPEPMDESEPKESQETKGPEPQPVPASPKPKAKPETPPKKDFRANLKSRPVDSVGAKTEEAEFKNVFGNLRKTKTQNYKAPDELKDNILRGKGALNVTGGPKKTERRDEFKEAILKKKEGFKQAQAEGKGVTRTTNVPAENSVPEGLAKRAELARAATVSKASTSTTSTSSASRKTSSSKPSPGPKRISSQSLSSPRATVADSVREKSPEPERLQRVSTEPQTSSSAEGAALPSLQKETSAPSKLQQRGAGGGGKLSDRFNPALAGMLARGPPPMATNGSQSGSKDTSGGASSPGVSSEPTAPGPQLTHMTKGRARGPRRKAPTKTATQSSTPSTAPALLPVKAAVVESPETDDTDQKEPQETVAKPTSPEITEATKPKPEPKKTALSSIQQQVAAKAALRGKPSPVSPPPKSPSLANSARPASVAQASFSTDARQGSPSPKPDDEEPPPSSPKKLDMKRMSRFLDESPSSNVSLAVATPEPKRLSHQRTGSKSPVKTTEGQSPEPRPSSPTKVDSEPITSVKNATSMFGGAGTTSPPPGPKPVFDRSPAAGASKAEKRASFRPLPGPPTRDVASPTSDGSPVRSPTKQDDDNLTTVLNEFFGTRRSKPSYKVDAAELLLNRPKADRRVESSGAQMIQITGDGKKLPVPAHNERTLFEREMYICAHDFTNEARKKVLEVYFWVGDEVPESTADDAQLFAQREARSLGGRLVRLEQGKETAEFLQALGGVVIVRRGSSNKYDSLAPNMLCGRRYLGQVAFDEVDFSPASLCSGFPYLITQAGKCYLWKGKGSDVEELGAAKLVGMELTLTGELSECEDGGEPESFWGMFDGGAKPHSADHWRLKPNYSKYGTRLFCSDSDSRQQIYEIRPFSQVDLSPSSIYVLDAFFEMYVIVGSRAQSQYASFHNALDFAQEYGILAASMEDRPFMPVSTVVLEGIPRDLKSVFRKWSDAQSPTITRPVGGGGGGGLRRGRSLRVVPLTDALQALNG